VLGWAWADTLAALVIAAFAIREGVAAWNGDTCATPMGELMETASGEHDHARDAHARDAHDRDAHDRDHHGHHDRPGLGA